MIFNPRATESINAAFQFIEFMNKGYLNHSRPELSDLFNMHFPQGEISQWPLGMKRGCMGVGLGLMKAYS